MSVAVKLASDMGHPVLRLSREADSSASLRNDKTKSGGMTNALRGLLAGLGVGEALVDFVPVDNVPPRGEVVGAAVVVFQVVGVLPDVVAEDGVEAIGEGTVLVGGGDDGE